MIDDAYWRDWRDRTEHRLGSLESDTRHGERARDELKGEIRDVVGELREQGRALQQTVLSLRTEFERDLSRVLETINGKLDAYERGRATSEANVLSDVRVLLEQHAAAQAPPASANGATAALPWRFLMLGGFVAAGVLVGVGVVIGLALKISDAVGVAQGAIS